MKVVNSPAGAPLGRDVSGKWRQSVGEVDPSCYRGDGVLTEEQCNLLLFDLASGTLEKHVAFHLCE